MKPKLPTPPPPFNMRAYLRFLRVEACNMRAKALYFTHAADEIEAAIELLKPPKK